MWSGRGHGCPEPWGKTECYWNQGNWDGNVCGAKKSSVISMIQELLPSEEKAQRLLVIGEVKQHSPASLVKPGEVAEVGQFPL